jgi:hypothetical protein
MDGAPQSVGWLGAGKPAGLMFRLPRSPKARDRGHPQLDMISREIAATRRLLDRLDGLNQLTWLRLSRMLSPFGEKGGGR